MATQGEDVEAHLPNERGWCRCSSKTEQIRRRKMNTRTCKGDHKGRPGTHQTAGCGSSDVDSAHMVGFRLPSSVAIDGPVTRGICTVGPDGLLASLDERCHVGRQGNAFRSDDGRESQAIAGDVPASVNPWGFHKSIWPVYHEVVDTSGLDGEARLAEVAAGREISSSEVLFPEVITTMVDDGTEQPVRVLTTEDKLLGVTRASDLRVVRAELGRQVAFGIRPDAVWAGVA